MKGNPDGSLSNYPSLRTLKASGFLDRLTGDRAILPPVRRSKQQDRLFYHPPLSGFYIICRTMAIEYAE